MSKITSAEKYYIEKVNEGYELINKNFTGDDIRCLLGSSLSTDSKVLKELKRALDAVYIRDIKQMADEAKSTYKSYAIKIYKGRETLLRDVVIGWYSSPAMPSIMDSIKGMFR
ncbi:MAG: hypothetical protein RR645_03460 [Clostridium sp.]